MSTITIKLTDQLLKRIEKQAYISDESVEEFVLNALEDAVNLWEDYADATEDKAESESPILYA